jgi:hypothetical protein
VNLVWSALVIVTATALAVAVMLLVRSRAPEGSFFEDGDRASGVFGVIATGFAILLGLVVVLAFTSYDESRSGAEAEALIVAQQFETAQFLPPSARRPLGDQLVCYARYVVHQSWPLLEDGTHGDEVNPWGVALFRTLKTVDPKTAPEQAAYGKWLDQTTDRESARQDRIHGAVGVIPIALWIVLFLTAAVIFWFMLFFADSGERWFVQATLIGAVTAIIVSTLLLIGSLDNPFHGGVGGLKPVAMERTLGLLDQERRIVGETGPVPCDAGGLPAS